MFYVGQKVRCVRNGEGVVVKIDERFTYSVDVDFASGVSDCYIEDGRMHEDDDEPSLSVLYCCGEQL